MIARCPLTNPRLVLERHSSRSRVAARLTLSPPMGPGGSYSRGGASDLDQGGGMAVLSGPRLPGMGRESPGAFSAHLGPGQATEVRAPRGDIADATRRGFAACAHPSLVRQVDDGSAPVNADDCFAYRIPLHLLILSAGCRSLHHGAC